jgi:hypothetical protein
MLPKLLPTNGKLNHLRFACNQFRADNVEGSCPFNRIIRRPGFLPNRLKGKIATDHIGSGQLPSPMVSLGFSRTELAATLDSNQKIRWRALGLSDYCPTSANCLSKKRTQAEIARRFRSLPFRAPRNE